MTTAAVQHAARPVSDANSQRPVREVLRDPIVAQAIENVTRRHQAEEFWAISPHERTQAIYDEIKRLDRAGPNRAVAPLKSKQSNLHHQWPDRWAPFRAGQR
jgi:hypothetical protein